MKKISSKFIDSAAVDIVEAALTETEERYMEWIFDIFGVPDMDEKEEERMFKIADRVSRAIRMKIKHKTKV